jgi:internalin A
MEVLDAWNRIKQWYAANAPGIIGDLNPPATSEQIQKLEARFDVVFPEAVRSFYATNNGQRGEHGNFGGFFGLEIMSLERILAIRSFSGETEISEIDEASVSVPANAIRPWFVGAKWIPFAEYGSSGFFAIDFEPDTAGRSGQIINYGRYARTKVVIAADFATFLEWIANDLERGKGRIYESAGMRLFDHADLGDGNIEDGLVKLFGP